MSDAPIEHSSTGLTAAEADAAVADLRRLGIAETVIKAAVEGDGLPYTPPAETAPSGSASLKSAAELRTAVTAQGYNINWVGVDLKPLAGEKHVAALDADLKKLFGILAVPAHEAQTLAHGMLMGAKGQASAKVPELHQRIEAYNAEQVAGAGAADRAKGVLDRARSGWLDLVNELEKRGAFSGRHAISVLARLDP